MDRNCELPSKPGEFLVALRKESVDRNSTGPASFRAYIMVALRKESVDRNRLSRHLVGVYFGSLSARRAWIEIVIAAMTSQISVVALRKESVDRNMVLLVPELVPW